MRILAILTLLFTSAVSYTQTIDAINAEKNFKSGMIRFYNREYEAAIQLFSKALSFEKLDSKARYYLGCSYLNAGYTKNAIDEWENIVKFGDTSYQIRQKLNDLYFRLAIDKSYDYSNPYVFTKLYSGLADGKHKINRPSFIIYDSKSDSTIVSSTLTKFVVELDGSGNTVREIGRNFGDFSTFQLPMGICLYDNKIYVADYKADEIFIYSREGKFLSKFGSSGVAPTNIAGPMGLYISEDEYLFAVDNGNDRIQKFGLKGEWIQSIGEGVLKRPTDVTGANGIIYVSDTFNKRIASFDTFGNMLESIGDGVLQEPLGLSIKNGKLYICDAENGLYIYDIAGKSLEKFSTDEHKVQFAFDACLDSKNILYETDFNTPNIAIFNPLQLQYANLGLQVSQIWLSSYPRNLIHLRVWDKTGKPVYNLKEANISIFEEGTEIPFIRMGPTFEFRKNMYAKIIIDKSETMREYEPELIEMLNSFLTRSTGDDWLDMVTVNDTMESTGRIPSSILRPVDFVKKIQYSGPYPEELDSALHTAVTGLLNINRNKAIIIFTAGEIGPSTFSNYDADMLSTYAKQNSIPVYVINFTDKNREIYERITEETFGRYYSMKDLKDILNIYSDIKNAPPLEYIISYEGLDLKGLRDKWINVHIKVRYKNLMGIDDTGYYVPELFTPVALPAQ
jgi:hypothetical protein